MVPGVCVRIAYQRLNSVSQINAHPMPWVDELLDRIRNTHFIATIELTWGCLQVYVTVKDRHNTAFGSLFSFFQFWMISFGLLWAPAAFWRRMDFIELMILHQCIYMIWWLIVQRGKIISTISKHYCYMYVCKADLTAKLCKYQCGMYHYVNLGFTAGGGILKPEICKLWAIQQSLVSKIKCDVRASLCI